MSGTQGDKPEGADALWYGRQLERHAARASEAARARAELRARLVELAASWRRRGAELRARARDVIPFGEVDGPSEKDAAGLDGEALALDMAAAELERLAEEG